MTRFRLLILALVANGFQWAFLIQQRPWWSLLPGGIALAIYSATAYYIVRKDK